MDQIFKNFSQKILIYLSISSEEDCLEFNTVESLLNSIPIRAIVSDYSFSKARWTMTEIHTDEIKEVTIEKKHESLLISSYKIGFEGKEYYGYKVNGRLQYRKEGDYIRFQMFTKHD